AEGTKPAATKDGEKPKPTGDKPKPAAGSAKIGIITKVDGDTITVEVRGDGGAVKSTATYTVKSDTVLFVDGKRGAVGDLKPEMRIGLQTGEDGKSITTAKAATAGKDGEKKPSTKPAGDKPNTKPTGDKPNTKPTGDKPSTKPTGDKPATEKSEK